MNFDSKGNDEARTQEMITAGQLQHHKSFDCLQRLTYDSNDPAVNYNSHNDQQPQKHLNIQIFKSKHNSLQSSSNYNSLPQNPTDNSYFEQYNSGSETLPISQLNSNSVVAQ